MDIRDRRNLAVHEGWRSTGSSEPRAFRRMPLSCTPVVVEYGKAGGNHVVEISLYGRAAPRAAEPGAAKPKLVPHESGNGRLACVVSKMAHDARRGLRP